MDRPRFTLLYGILPKCRPRRTRNRDADSICTSVQAFPTHQFKVFRKWADQKWVGSSDQNESLTEMLEVGAVNEDMDMPPWNQQKEDPTALVMKAPPSSTRPQAHRQRATGRDGLDGKQLLSARVPTRRATSWMQRTAMS